MIHCAAESDTMQETRWGHGLRRADCSGLLAVVGISAFTLSRKGNHSTVLKTGFPGSDLRILNRIRSYMAPLTGSPPVDDGSKGRVEELDRRLFE